MTRSTNDPGTARPYALAIDLGGTHLRVASVSHEGKIAYRRRIGTPGRGEPEAVIPAIVSLVREARRWPAPAAPVGLGVAAPGPLDPAAGVVLEVPNMAGWHDVPLAAMLEDEIGLPVHLHNDASLAGLGEARHGAVRGFDPIVYLTVSTGVGGGIVVGRRIYEGRHGMAGELGHMVVGDGGPACNFGHSGCLEALASGTAIARRARELLDRGETSDIRLHCGEGGVVTARSVALAADAGDGPARRVFENAGRALGVAIGSLINAFDPARVIVGGGVCQSWHLLEGPAHDGIRAVAMAWRARPIDVVTSELGDDAGLIGAAAHAFDLAG